MTHVIDGRRSRASMIEQYRRSAARLRGRGVIPALAVVMPADDGSAAWYARSIVRAAARTGIECRIYRLPPDQPRGERVTARGPQATN